MQNATISQSITSNTHIHCDVHFPRQAKKIGTAPERTLAALEAELRATDKRYHDAMITKNTTEFIVKRIAKVSESTTEAIGW